MKKNYALFLSSLVALFVLTAIAAVAFGSLRISPKDIVLIILEKIGLKKHDAGIDDALRFIVINVRLPRVISAALVGAILSVVGASYQAVFKNPMADPYVMGVSSGAAFGATIAIVFFEGKLSGVPVFGIVSLFAFISAFLTSLFVYRIASTRGRVDTLYVLLSGIVVSAIFGAFINFMMILDSENLQKIVYWTMGSFNGADFKKALFILPFTVFGTAYLYAKSRELNMIVMGEKEAAAMGLEVEKFKRRVLIISSLMASLAVSVAGIIGFVGLIVPHLLRLIVSANHKRLIPASIFGGAVFMIISDTVARSLFENMELPIGVISAAIGGPFFIFLLIKAKRANR